MSGSKAKADQCEAHEGMKSSLHPTPPQQHMTKLFLLSGTITLPVTQQSQNPLFLESWTNLVSTKLIYGIHFLPKKKALSTLIKALFTSKIQEVTLFGEKASLGERSQLLLMLLLLLFTESEIERLVFELGATPILVLWGWEVSTSFLERWRHLCMCLSQYFFCATASLLHLHFFPSVLLHLPGSGSEWFILILLSHEKGLDPKTWGRTFSRFSKQIKQTKPKSNLKGVLTVSVKWRNHTIGTTERAGNTLPYGEKKMIRHGKPCFHVLVDKCLKL